MSVRLRDLIAAERIRLLSLRSTHYFLACSLLVAVAAACLLSAFHGHSHRGSRHDKRR